MVRVGAVGQVPAAHGAEALRGHVRGHGVVHGRVEVGAGEVGEGFVAQEVHGSHASLRLLLGLGGHLAVAGLDPVLLHRQWAVDLPTGTTQRGEHNNNNNVKKKKKKNKNKNKEEEGGKNKTVIFKVFVCFWSVSLFVVVVACVFVLFCLFVCFVCYFNTNIYWCNLLIHTVSMIIVRSVKYHLGEKTLIKKGGKKKEETKKKNENIYSVNHHQRAAR